MIKSILFDLDDTILDFKKSERLALTKALARFGVEADDYIVSQYSKYNISQWKRLEKGEITRQQVKVNRFRLLFDELGLDLSPQQVTEVYEENLCYEYHFVENALSVIQSLYGKYDLYLVSNGAKRVQEQRLKGTDLARYFKGIFISEDVGYEKPSREFFSACFSAIPDLDKSQTVIIGDSLSSDITGGKNAGIKTIWFNPDNVKNNTPITPDYEIKSLLEIENLLAEKMTHR